MPAEAEPASQLSARIEDLVQRVEAIADPAVRSNVTALVQSLLELHSRALARIAEHLNDANEPGRRILQTLADDDLVGGLLLLYGQHPDGQEARLAKALRKLQDGLQPSGSSMEFMGVEDGVARVRLIAKGGCGGAAEAVAKAIEDNLYSAVPELVRVDVETRTDGVRASDLVQLQVSVAARQS